MEKLACSRLWTDLNLIINKKELVNCCKRTQEFEPTLEDIKNYGLDLWAARPELLAEKKQMVEENVFPRGCKACSARHPNSHWNTWNKWRGHPESFYNDDLYKRDETRFICLSLSSTCNMSCLYCNEEISSLWAKKLGKETNPDIEWKEAMLDSLYKYIDQRVAPNQPQVKYNLLGGEPFLDYSFFDFVKTIADIHQKHNTKRVIVEFISNLNVKPAVVQKFIDLTKQYKNIDWIISGSLENLGKRAESSRVELDFELFETNLDNILSNEHIKVQILPTMNILSIADHADFVDWVFTKFLKLRGMDRLTKRWGATMNSVTYGYMDVGYAPTSFGVYIDNAIDMINHHVRNGLAQPYINHLKDIKKRLGTLRNEKTIKEIKDFFEGQSKFHNIDYVSVFPELEEVFDENR